MIRVLFEDSYRFDVFLFLMLSRSMLVGEGFAQSGLEPAPSPPVPGALSHFLCRRNAV